MRFRTLRRRLAVGSSLSATVAAAVLVMGMGIAQPASAAISIPAFPTFGTYPEWLPANYQVSNIDISEGSDTTLDVMEQISDLYSEAGLYPFSCELTSNNQDCTQPSGGINPNNTQSDTVDNFADSTEVQGTNDTGSSNGQGELCGTLGSPANTTVDYARSSKPFGISGCSGVGFGFAKDAVTAVDFQSIDPELYGTPTGYNTIGAFTSYDYTTGGVISTPFPSSGIGDVADGWLPGDPYNCGYNGAAACSGTPFSDVDSTATVSSGLSRASSTAYRLWCEHGAPSTTLGAGNTGLSQITDWGNLTNLGPNVELLGVSLTSESPTATLQTNEDFPAAVAAGDTITGPDIAPNTTVAGVSGGTLTLSSNALNTTIDTVHINLGTALQPGQGPPIGVPIRVIGDNGSSGTASTWNNFAKSSIGSGNCTTAPTNGVGGNYNPNAASGPNPETNQGTSDNLEIALENDANQIGDFANANWGATDPADQAVDIATSLYFMGNGAYLSNPNASVASLEVNSGLVPSGDPSTFTATELTANGVAVSVPSERNNSFPASRTLWNIVRTDTVRASVGGFLDWLCDGGSTITINGSSISPMVTKGTDHVDGGNYDTDLTNIINGEDDLSRLTDTTQELSASAQTSGNGVLNPNGTCEANVPISSSSGSISSGSTTVTLAPVGSTSISPIEAGWPVYVPTGYSLSIPSGTTVASVSGDTITLSKAVTTGTGTSLPSALYFPGHPPVLAVANPNS